MGGWVNGWMGEWVYGWMGEWVDGLRFMALVLSLRGVVCRSNLLLDATPPAAMSGALIGRLPRSRRSLAMTAPEYESHNPAWQISDGRIASPHKPAHLSTHPPIHPSTKRCTSSNPSTHQPINPLTIPPNVIWFKLTIHSLPPTVYPAGTARTPSGSPPG